MDDKPGGEGGCGKKCTIHKRTHCKKYHGCVWDRKHFVALAGLAGVAMGTGRDRKGLAAVTVLSVFSRPCAKRVHRKCRCRGDSVSQHGAAVTSPHTHTHFLSALTDNSWKAGNIVFILGFLIPGCRQHCCLRAPGFPVRTRVTVCVEIFSQKDQIATLQATSVIAL